MDRNWLICAGLLSHWLVAFSRGFFIFSPQKTAGNTVGKVSSGTTLLSGHLSKCLRYSLSYEETVSNTRQRPLDTALRVSKSFLARFPTCPGIHLGFSCAVHFPCSVSVIKVKHRRLEKDSSSIILYPTIPLFAKLRPVQAEYRLTNRFCAPWINCDI
jgi:hypothetical protein